MTRYLILGNSAAGLSAVDAIRQRDGDGLITVVSREPGPAYSRVALPYLLAGQKSLGQITLHGPDYYEARKVTLVQNVGAVGLDAQDRTVRLEDGRSLPYDRLLIATGSAPVMPPVPGIEEADVCYHWTLADARKIAEKAQGAKRCLVIGAGFIGLLTVNALLPGSSIRFTVVEMADQVMPQLLDREAGHVLERAMRREGIELVLGDTVAGIQPRAGGGYDITLRGGKGFAADMIVCGAGVRPNVDFLNNCSGLELDRGVLTNPRQETSLPGVYAAGDCAEGLDFLSGERAVHAIWPTAVDQGRVAGANMAGGDEAYPGSLSWNVTELFGLSCASIGEFQAREGCEEVIFHNPQADSYRKLLLQCGRIVGVVMVGRPEHVQELGVVQALIRRRTDVSRWRHLLRSERVSYAMLAYKSARR